MAVIVDLCTLCEKRLSLTPTSFMLSKLSFGFYVFLSINWHKCRTVAAPALYVKRTKTHKSDSTNQQQHFLSGTHCAGTSTTLRHTHVYTNQKKKKTVHHEQIYDSKVSITTTIYSSPLVSLPLSLLCLLLSTVCIYRHFFVE